MGLPLMYRVRFCSFLHLAAPQFSPLSDEDKSCQPSLCVGLLWGSKGVPCVKALIELQSALQVLGSVLPSLVRSFSLAPLSFAGELLVRRWGALGISTYAKWSAWGYPGLFQQICHWDITKQAPETSVTVGGSTRGPKRTNLALGDRAWS